MSKKNTPQHDLEFLFHPNSIALVGITTAETWHWTRTFLEGLLEIGFDRPLYLVNPKGGEIKGHKIYTSLKDVPGNIDYVIGLVNAQVAPKLVEECAEKGVRAIHFCTAGFSETGEEQRVKLESELVEVARRKGIRIIGPNCMGIYCPQSRLSFSPAFPKESGPVGVISQSGGNSIYLVRQAALRGVRFSKVISYGNACDINENDLLEYLANDADTKIIALYIEGIKDGKRFRKTLEEATKKKTVILLKGGATEGGARAAASHTASLAGSRATWDALCKQLGIISVSNLEEMIDVLVTLLFLPLPRGRNALLFGAGGGASVIIADEFENRGLRVPPLPPETIAQIREFTPIAGNILRNPVDYSQAMMNLEGVIKTLGILSRWDGADFLVTFVRTGQFTTSRISEDHLNLLMSRFSVKQGLFPKPVAMVLEPSIMPKEAEAILAAIRGCISAGLPVYYTFAAAANAINLVLNHTEKQPKRVSG
ncbi:MAG TPA: CoA-binding protein [Dehalococcoidia bacterium]|nr:CoA-binding protein [Dehalococcoidia bacterium]